jgi:hypothetical protein
LGKRGNFTFRVREVIRERLIASANASNVSVSEEIERRIEQTFSSAGVVAEMLGGPQTARLMAVIALAIQGVERTTGREWWTDKATFDAVNTAITGILLLNDPSPVQGDPKYPPLADLRKEWKDPKFPPLAELGKDRGPFIDHFAIGGHAASFALAMARVAVEAKTPASDQEERPANKRPKPSRKVSKQ